VLGAFANVEPAGAAQAIDRMLHGAISDLARRRAISAAAGEVFVLPSGARGLAPRLVVFAGLGNFGATGRRAAPRRGERHADARALGRRELRDGALGHASGTEPRRRARAQLEGVLTALADLEPSSASSASPSSRATRQARRARRVAEDLLAPASRGAAAAARAASASRGAKAGPLVKPSATPLAWLFVQESRAQLRVALLGPAPKATALVAIAGSTAPARARALAPRAGHLDRRPRGVRRAALGPCCCRPRSPRPCRRWKGSPLVVVHDTASAHWPWEVLSLKGWAPAASKGLSRRYAAEGMSVAKWREQRRRAPRVQRPARDQPDRRPAGAVEEGERVAAMLTQIEGAGITAIAAATRRARGSSPNSAPATTTRSTSPAMPGSTPRRPASERHPVRGRPRALGQRPGRDGLRAGARLLQCLRIRAAARDGQPAAPARPQRRLRRGFLRGGVANFIGTWWPVSDAAASTFATTLYRDLAQGESIGSALERRARRRARACLPPTGRTTCTTAATTSR
jgi:hypothetical protein